MLSCIIYLIGHTYGGWLHPVATLVIMLQLMLLHRFLFILWVFDDEPQV